MAWRLPPLSPEPEPRCSLCKTLPRAVDQSMVGAVRGESRAAWPQHQDLPPEQWLSSILPASHPGSLGWGRKLGQRMMGSGLASREPQESLPCHLAFVLESQEGNKW